ncbi:MAG: hypothetical protein ACI399_07920 [Candidatus Cryptobacteroides sp.]
MKLRIVVNSEGSPEAVSACVEECRRQCDQLVTREGDSIDIILNEKGSAGCSLWDSCPENIPDFCLWLGRPVLLKENAVSSLMLNSGFLRHKAIIACTVADQDGKPLYGGRLKRGKLLEPDSTIPVPCHLYDTAMLFVPYDAFARVAIPSDIFTQSFFDYGCGEKPCRAGVPRVLAPGILASTSDAKQIPAMLDPSLSLAKRIEAFIVTVFQEAARAVRSLFR